MMAPGTDSTHDDDGRMRRIFIHVGLHKTGTTSLQNYLANHRTDLRQHGILVPKAGVPAGFIGGQHLLPWSLMDDRSLPDPSAGREEVWRALRDEIDDSPCQRVILSSEDFSFLRPPAIAIVARHLRGHAVVPVIVLRRSSDVVEGGYRTHLYSGATESFAAFCAGSTLRRDYAAMIDDWRAISAGEMLVVSYDDPAIGSDVVPALMRLLAPDVEVVLDAAERANPGMPAPILELGRMLRSQGVAVPQMQRWAARMATGVVSSRSMNADRFMTPEVEAELDRAYREEVARIAGDDDLARHVRSDIPLPAPRTWTTIDGPTAALLGLPDLLGRYRTKAAPETIPERLFPSPTHPRPGRVSGFVDQPAAAGGMITIDRQRPVDFAGWLFEMDAGSVGTRILHLQSQDPQAAGSVIIPLPQRLQRSDVADSFPGIPTDLTVPSGFAVRLDPGPLPRGRYRLRLGVADAAGIAYARNDYAVEIC